MSIDSGWDNPAYEATEKPSEGTGNGSVKYDLSNGVELPAKSNGDIGGEDNTVTVRTGKQNGVAKEARLSTVSGTSQAPLVGKDDEDPGTCGWLNFRPAFIQVSEPSYAIVQYPGDRSFKKSN